MTDPWQVASGILRRFSCAAPRGSERYLWDYLIHHHHYLGRPKLVGEHLKQLAFIEEQVVACLGWASAAWKVGCRDRFIGWSSAQRRERLSAVVNNVRFLLLPWVPIDATHSHTLSLCPHCQQRRGRPIRQRFSRLLKDAMRLKTEQANLEAAEYERRERRLHQRLDQLIAVPGIDAGAKRLAKRLKNYRGELLKFLDHAAVPASHQTLR